MTEGLAPLDGLVLLAVVAKAAGYGAALLAMGGALFVAAFPRADPMVLRRARRMAAGAALALLAVLALRFGLRAARLSGMGVDGALDPVMLNLLWDGPMGDAALWRGGGAVAILAVVLPGAGRWVALAGAGAMAVSYAQVGHSLGEPRAALAALVTAHVLLAAFWVGALPPLHRAASAPGGGATLHRFGTLAAWAVPLLAVAGAATAWLLGAAAWPSTAYGWGLAVKLALVCALLALAARNKLALVPAIAAGRAGAAGALRRSIAWEGAAVAAILLVTAALTTATTPPAAL